MSRKFWRNSKTSLYGNSSSDDADEQLAISFSPDDWTSSYAMPVSSHPLPPGYVSSHDGAWMEVIFRGAAITLQGFCHNATLSVALFEEPPKQIWKDCDHAQTQLYTRAFERTQVQRMRFTLDVESDARRATQGSPAYMGFDSVSVARPLTTSQSIYASLALVGPRASFASFYFDSLALNFMLLMTFILVFVTRTYRIFVIFRYLLWLGWDSAIHLKQRTSAGSDSSTGVAAPVLVNDDPLELTGQVPEGDTRPNLEGTSETEQLLLLSEEGEATSLPGVDAPRPATPS